MTYEIACICGETVRGNRQARHQVVSCSGCGRSVFVLPLSPYEVKASALPAPARADIRSWRGPLIAGGVSLLVLVIGFAIALPFLSRPESKKSVPQGPDADELRAAIDEGRQALSQGKFHLARETLNAVARRTRWTGLLSPAEHRQLIQLQRQADFFARLLVHSTLEDIVQHGKLVRDAKEWQARFNDNYRGRTVLFDDVVRRDTQRRPVLANHVFEVDDEIIRVALEDVTLLRDLPLDDGPRLIFGARLQACIREEGGGWVVHFEPDSGVLLTEQSAVEACLPDPGDDLRSTLARQQRWLDSLSGQWSAASGQ